MKAIWAWAAVVAVGLALAISDKATAQTVMQEVEVCAPVYYRDVKKMEAMTKKQIDDCAKLSTDRAIPSEIWHDAGVKQGYEKSDAQLAEEARIARKQQAVSCKAILDNNGQITDMTKYDQLGCSRVPISVLESREACEASNKKFRIENPEIADLLKIDCTITEDKWIREGAGG